MIDQNARLVVMTLLITNTKSNVIGDSDDMVMMMVGVFSLGS